jgi:CDGSH-type Zn-finger protein
MLHRLPALSLDDLRAHLQWALELEHATIPPYLCALYSIKPGHNREAVENLASVFIEEMLHMTLAANLLNAVGGAPVIDAPGFIPTYPTALPHCDDSFVVSLEPFSPSAVATFMKIERPQAPATPSTTGRYRTIGEFYLAIEEGVKALCAAHGERAVFTGDPTRQVTAEMLPYRGSGCIIPVYDLESALSALDEIEEQGEGLKHDVVWDGDRDMFHPERNEVAHYFRFVEIANGRAFQRGDTPQTGPSGNEFGTDWTAVHPMRSNPRSQDYPEDSPVRVKMHAFNRLYSDILRALHRAFNGEPQRLFGTLAAMSELGERAKELMQMPSGDGTTMAGPSFEYVPHGGTTDDVPMKISIRRNGPYVVEGGVPLVRKAIVYSERHEPLTWRTTTVVDTDGSYRLCRCGHSSRKPFCDGSHARVSFDGTETADMRPTAERGVRLEGERITLIDDGELCTGAGFCGNRTEKIWTLMQHTADAGTRMKVIHMAECCPSGRLACELPDAGIVEPDLPQAIAVTDDGPYWVTGGIAIELPDGRLLETRNRVTLCRCGQSCNKPLCDGTHKGIRFRDPG